MLTTTGGTTRPLQAHAHTVHPGQIVLEGATEIEFQLFNHDDLYTILYFDVKLLVGDPPLDGDQVLEMEPRGELLVNINFGVCQQQRSDRARLGLHGRRADRPADRAKRGRGGGMRRWAATVRKDQQNVRRRGQWTALPGRRGGGAGASATNGGKATTRA